ncbi:MarR family winged helix-turn-helix transcriptional regulator [Lactococcus termiticola]|uniref:MarR family transcriptional regulator n=1 Tax=Lactococcus termiticola TaxID=2169526 RepID=A0A2R5HF01_9LACT|nr:MarR family winged helix-turn-helix transcriptional regulator [Lactococcus termiticola]GBG96629.1 MarR family transcriptional regulator [Lactococcus termiticola]
MDYNQLAETFMHRVKGKGQTEVWSRFHAYTHGERQVLFYLYKSSGKPVMPSDIAKYTDTSTARVATILNNLEEKGLVTREISREDRRKILVGITGKGREIADAQRQKAISHVARILAEMGEEEATKFVQSFQNFLEIGIKIACAEEQEEEEKNV